MSNSIRNFFRKKTEITPNIKLAAYKILKWWKKYSATKELKSVYQTLNNIPKNNIQQLFDMSFAIKKKFDNLPGGGLSCGTLVDLLISEFFNKNIPQSYKEHRQDENDFILANIPLSFKKISGKSSIALDWSKNKNKNEKTYFNSHILILNLVSSKWNDQNIKAGFYIIDRKFCKLKIHLSANNKTNSLITYKELHKMLSRSINQNLFIPGPDTHSDLEFNLLNCFNNTPINS